MDRWDNIAPHPVRASRVALYCKHDHHGHRGHHDDHGFRAHSCPNFAQEPVSGQRAHPSRKCQDMPSTLAKQQHLSSLPQPKHVGSQSFFDSIKTESKTKSTSNEGSQAALHRSNLCRWHFFTIPRVRYISTPEATQNHCRLTRAPITLPQLPCLSIPISYLVHL